MQKRITQCTIIFLFLLTTQVALAQSSECFAQINQDVWSKFYQAFDSLDYEQMAAIHLKDLIRITGDSKKISGYDEYIIGYKKTFARAQENKENDLWKILMDYDSSENDTIGEAAYDKAFPIDDFQRFVRD